MAEAEELLKQMPPATLQEKRTAAMFALAYLGGLRADTLVSLRLAHIDIERRTILQDGRAARTKNGKSLIIYWFPIPEVFSETVMAWIETMKQMGFHDDDALFPKLDWFEKPNEITMCARPPVAVMSTTQAVGDAFARASKYAACKYTPHSAKHTLAAECDRRPLTREQRKAWSENLGHENELTTKVYYGKMSGERRSEVIEGIGNGSLLIIDEMTTEEKATLVDQVLAHMIASR